ncbi:helix-turn-helix domain-containing protein [Pontibacter virosus]|uniref:Helix-turn-helix protein n=1 Tax=Pontibacter virosus TaxID=1765052 RepID=A0A2U1B3B2_9BACT|nr:helix-turn-helix domain-containing protein [Pontibacter virosus]PVY43153.1 hypothetical protein C8E01_102330 [Pontibacter virosus]
MVDTQTEEELNFANLHELTTMLDKIRKTGLSRNLLVEYVDLYLTLRVKKFNEGDLQSQLVKSVNELDRYRNTLKDLYNSLSDVIIKRKHEIYSGQKAKDFNQPKYKLNDCAKILGVSRQTLYNWADGKGGYITAYDAGKNKFVLESDLKAKYREIHKKELNPDDSFRSIYEYKIKPEKLADFDWDAFEQNGFGDEQRAE